MKGLPVKKGFCGDCVNGCWITCQPKNYRGHCQREIEDARRIRAEYEEWFDSKRPAQLVRYFGERVTRSSLLWSVIIDHFGENMILEDIW